MSFLELAPIFLINKKQVIKLKDFAKLLNYSDVYLLRIVKGLSKIGIKIGFKYKRNWYIVLPQKPIKSILNNENNLSNTIKQNTNTVTTPSGSEIDVNWAAALDNIPIAVRFVLEETLFNPTSIDKQLMLPISFGNEVSSTLGPKRLTSFKPINLGSFQSTSRYKYGYYIEYKESHMSTFDPGTSGLLNSTQLPAAFFEICRALDAAENARNGANPGLAPQRNISTTVSFDTGTIAVAATLPITVAIGANGKVDVTASDYLGAGFADFDLTANGDGQLPSDTLPEALMEMATTLSNAEKAVTPAENQPDNVQVVFDLEEGSATISANLPFTSAAASDGAVTVVAIDYLP